MNVENRKKAGKVVLFSYSRCLAQREQGVKTNTQMTDLPAPMEELLTVTIDDTANTLFRTGITRFIGHNSFFLFVDIKITRLSKL